MELDEKLKKEIERAAEANGNQMIARAREINRTLAQHQGPMMVHSWEHIPGTEDEVFVQTVIVHDHMGKPFIGRAYLRSYELELYNFEAGYLVAAGKAYRQLADELTRRGLAKVRSIFGMAEAGVAAATRAAKEACQHPPEHIRPADMEKHEGYGGSVCGMCGERVDHLAKRRLSHERRLADALGCGRIIICDQCSRPYGAQENLVYTWKGNLFVCPHCCSVVPKSTLEELKDAAKVMPPEQVAQVVIERLDGSRKWVENKDGTITEKLIAPAEPESKLENICPKCRRGCKKSKWTCPDYLPPMKKGSLCYDCSHQMECSNSHKMITACPDFHPRHDTDLDDVLIKTVPGAGNGDTVITGLTPEEMAAKEGRELQERRNVAAHVIAEAICPKPDPEPKKGKAVGAYMAIAGAMAPVGIEHMPEMPTVEFRPTQGECVICKQVDRVGDLVIGSTACIEGFTERLCAGHADVFSEFWEMGLDHEGAMAAVGMFYEGLVSKEHALELVAEHGPEKAMELAKGGKPELTVKLGVVKTTCCRCGKDLERDPADGSDLCDECKAGGWMNMEDGEWHRFSYWKGPKGLKWDMFQCLCEKYLTHPEQVMVPDGNMNVEEEPVCSVCLEKYKGATK